MIQDIKPNIYRNNYSYQQIKDNDTVVFVNSDCILIKEGEKLEYPKYSQVKDRNIEFTYLFSINDEKYFLAEIDERVELEGYNYENKQIFRERGPKYLAFAGITATQLNNWYRNNRYCGRCSKPLIKSKVERALKCPECKNMIYPKICPAVIVGIINKDKILVTKYAGKEKGKYALVAGFVEIGETLEETVRREVMEEVGVRVKNITYYKNQPWSFTDTLLVGFYCELDGSDEIKMDESELCVAEWKSREELDVKLNDLSLTNEMIVNFLNQK